MRHASPTLPFETRAVTRPTAIVGPPVVREGAAQARVATETARRQVLKGALPVVRIGQHGLVRRSDFLRYLRA